jgi:hypothetical protein
VPKVQLVHLVQQEPKVPQVIMEQQVLKVLKDQ